MAIVFLHKTGFCPSKLLFFLQAHEKGSEGLPNGAKNTSTGILCKPPSGRTQVSQKNPRYEIYLSAGDDWRPIASVWMMCFGFQWSGEINFLMPVSGSLLLMVENPQRARTREAIIACNLSRTTCQLTSSFSQKKEKIPSFWVSCCRACICIAHKA